MTALKAFRSVLPAFGVLILSLGVAGPAFSSDTGEPEMSVERSAPPLPDSPFTEDQSSWSATEESVQDANSAQTAEAAPVEEEPVSVSVVEPETGEDIAPFMVAEAEQLPDAVMNEMRAGFIDPSGMIYRFAVDVRTEMDGALAFVRSIVLQADPQGQLQATNTMQLLSQNLPAGAVANVLNNGGGLAITDKNGNTTLLNQTPTGALANVIINTADNRNITQTMNIDIVLNHVQTIAGAANAGHIPPALAGLAQGAHMHKLGFGF